MAECLNCNTSFIGRADKKYCSDQCRSEAYNKKNSGSNSYIREINAVLRKNRKILLELNPTGKNKVHKDMLLSRGYRFDYHTHTYTTKAGKVYYFCYEHGYLSLGNDFYALVIRDLDKQKT